MGRGWLFCHLHGVAVLSGCSVVLACSGMSKNQWPACLRGCKEHAITWVKHTKHAHTAHVHNIFRVADIPPKMHFQCACNPAIVCIKLYLLLWLGFYQIYFEGPYGNIPNHNTFSTWAAGQGFPSVYYVDINRVSSKYIFLDTILLVSGHTPTCQFPS